MKNVKKALVAVIMGSESDYPTMKEACEILEEFNIPYETHILSAHRTPDDMRDFALKARDNGLKVIIAGAGGAAHLPGMTAAYTTIPVIGVPIESKILKGIDSLFSIVQMPKGVPVATVAIGNAVNAGLLAASILSTSDKVIAKKCDDYRIKMNKKVLSSRKTLKTSK
jgi:5-(carboxyamino)imidazole ribonucleotide mutase